MNGFDFSLWEGNTRVAFIQFSFVTLSCMWIDARQKKSIKNKPSTDYLEREILDTHSISSVQDLDLSVFAMEYMYNVLKCFWRVGFVREVCQKFFYEVSLLNFSIRKISNPHKNLICHKTFFFFMIISIAIYILFHRNRMILISIPFLDKLLKVISFFFNYFLTSLMHHTLPLFNFIVRGLPANFSHTIQPLFRNEKKTASV